MNRSRFSRPKHFLKWTALSRSGLLAMLWLLVLPGCTLLDWSTAWLFPTEAGSPTNPIANPLGKIPTSPTAVTLEIVFVERPVDDPLLGNLLWDEVDQIGALPADERRALGELGFRVGRVGANPPQALQTLMGLTTEVGNEEEKRLVGRRVVLPSGAETEITAGIPHAQATINLPTSAGMELKSFENIRGVFRMKAKQLQEGWVRIEFLPEVHHGRQVNRPVAVRGGWQLNTAQAIERLYGQKFALDMNIGEMVLITGDAEPADSLGKHFFHASQFSDRLASSRTGLGEPSPAAGVMDSPPGIQRLLIIRLADISTAKSIYAEK